MQAEALDTLHRACPFRPFSIDMSDGREVRVGHPEQLARGEQTIVVFEERGNAMRVIDLTLVTGIQLNGDSQAGGRAGF